MDAREGGTCFRSRHFKQYRSTPPEMLRKGRFDEIFFVDLPGANTRSEIIDIHLRKKGRNEEAESFNLDRLAEASVGYSGAELEEAVKDALFRAFDAGREIEEEDILRP